MQLSVEQLIADIKKAIEIHDRLVAARDADDHMVDIAATKLKVLGQPWAGKKRPTSCLPMAVGSLRAATNSLISHLELVGGDEIAAVVKQLSESLNGPPFIPPRLR